MASPAFNDLGHTDPISAMADPMSPYFLTHADNPGMILVSQPLNGDNYIAWSRSMMIALSAKNKLGFVNGSLPRPNESNPNLLAAWVRGNSIVISWILNSISKESRPVLFSLILQSIYGRIYEIVFNNVMVLVYFKLDAILRVLLKIKTRLAHILPVSKLCGKNLTITSLVVLVGIACVVVSRMSRIILTMNMS